MASPTLRGDQFLDASIEKNKLALVNPTTALDPVTLQFLEDQGYVVNTITVNGQPLSNNILITSTTLGLGLVDNTPDISKPVSSPQKIYIDTKLPFGSIQNFRDNFEHTLLNTYQVTDKYKEGVFQYDSTDTTSTDDGALVLVKGTKRYKRIYNGEIDIKWFGAIPNAPTTFVQTQIQAAANKAGTLKQTLLINDGSYYINANVSFPCSVKGNGVIKTRGTNTRVYISLIGAKVEGITVDGLGDDNITVVGGGFYITNIGNIHFDRIKVTNIVGAGIGCVVAPNLKVTNSYFKNFKGENGDCIYLNAVRDAIILGNTFEEWGRIGITGENNSYRPNIFNNVFKNALRGETTQVVSAIHCENVRGCMIIGNYTENTYQAGIVVNLITGADAFFHDAIICNNHVKGAERGMNIIGGAHRNRATIIGNTIVDCSIYYLSLIQYKTANIIGNTFGLNEMSNVDRGTILSLVPSTVNKSTYNVSNNINETTPKTDESIILFPITSNLKCDLTVRNCVGQWNIRTPDNFITGKLEVSNTFLDYSNIVATDPRAFSNFVENIFENCRFLFLSTNNYTFIRTNKFRNCDMTTSDGNILKLAFSTFLVSTFSLENCNLNHIVLFNIRINGSSFVLKGNTIANYGSAGFMDTVVVPLGYIQVENNRFYSDAFPTAIPLQISLVPTNSDFGSNSYRSSDVVNITRVKYNIVKNASAAGTTAPSKSSMNTNYGGWKAGSVITYPSITGGGKKYRKISDDNTSDWEPMDLQPYIS